ncbi:MAG: response regulator [Lachnospiraceae bacterium]|nr:response regulator [Lachnospiraceae bacterium]
MYKIMLADDEGIVIDSLRFIIEKEFGDSCQIESAKTGRNVIELAEHFRPDIAFMDIQMPGINGIEAMKEIKENSGNTLFIVMSAYDKFDYAKEAINLGVLEYLNKPVEKSKIIDVLRRAMGLIDKEREKRRQDLMIREKMETVVPIIENGLIYSLMFKEYFEEDVDNFKNLLNITEDYCYMGVLVFGEKQVGNHMTNAVGTSVLIQDSYNEVREIIRGYFKCIVGSVMANKIAVLIPVAEEGLDYNERIALIDKAREMVRKLRERLDISFRMGLGPVGRLRDSMKSYSEALRALLQSDGSVAHVDDIPVGCDYEENYPVETEREIFEHTEKGNIEEQRSAVNRYFDWMVENYGDCESDIALKVLEFVLWAEKIGYEGSNRIYRFKSRQDYLPDIMGMKGDMERMRTWFLDKMDAAVRNVADNKETRSNGVVAKAKAYINANFHKEISLDDVSREVDISPYYFSKIFKEETGKNFIEYVTEIRMEKAKELLQSSSLSMKEICGEVGYADPNYFSRTFKKNVGLTPTEYKEGKSGEKKTL